MTMTLHPTTLRPAPAPRPRSSVLAVVMLCAVVLSGAAARPAFAADDGVRWTVKAAANGFGAGRTDYAYTLSPGGRLDDAVEITNQGTTALRLAIGTADATTSRAGRLALVPRGPRSKDVSTWVRFERDEVSVPPDGAVTVPFTVSPPKDASAGDHVGGIVATLAGSAPAGGAAAPRGPGLPIRLRVSGALKPSLAVEALKTHYSGTANPVGAGDARVTYRIRNTGNTILSARQSVSASGPFGSWSRRAAPIADSPPLLPGGTWQVSASLHDVAPAFRQSATVRLVPLLADVAGSVAPLAATTATAHAVAVPWTLLLVVVVVAGAVVAVLRRHRRATAPRPAADGAVA
ncbi:DUF916 domain-containing protein [Patulibacter sp. NPDC049589]|uniref:WxL protein peptidoglycan domain-containing protein n=1 Tax=Patulibacter sp. NPDC049589 TaxID=3154731 RepID=UPI0034129207